MENFGFEMELGRLQQEPAATLDLKAATSRLQMASNQLAGSIVESAKLLFRTQGKLKNANKIIAEQKQHLKKASKKIKKLEHKNVKVINVLMKERRKRLDGEKKFAKLLQEFEEAKKLKLGGLDNQIGSKVEETCQVPVESIECCDIDGLDCSGLVLIEKDQKNEENFFSKK